MKLVSLQSVIANLQGASRVRLLMVVACRDNEAIQQLASRLPADVFETGQTIPAEALFLEYREANGEILTPE